MPDARCQKDKSSSGYWLLATGYWLLVTGYWLLVTGYWLLIFSLPDPLAQHPRRDHQRNDGEQRDEERAAGHSGIRDQRKPDLFAYPFEKPP